MLHISMYLRESDSAQRLREIVFSYLRANKFSSILSTYCKIDGMIKCIREDDSDIYIIDFSNVREGKELVELIRCGSLIPAVVIVNMDCDSLKDYLYLRPSALVERIEDTKSLIQAISRLKKEIALVNRYFAFKCDGEMIRIPYDNIGFFESSGRKVTLHVFGSTAKYYFSAKLDDIETALPDNFLRCHQSYIVNMRHISKFDRVGRTFYLFSKDEVFISKRMYGKVLRKYERFIQAQGQQGRLRMPEKA